MKKRLNLKNLFIFAFIILTFLFFGIVPFSNFQAVSAATYTNVLTDLKQDESFDLSIYPSIPDDYSINVIQIAESVDNELFIYTYQPSGANKNVLATSINISVEVGENLDYVNYKLIFLNSAGVFYKYKVKDFTVKSDSVRYYDITSIYRKWIKGVDDETGNDNTITEVNFNISKQYWFETVDGSSYCSFCMDTETIVITDKFVGFVRYPDGYKLHVGACDSHFVAFNTDKQIDKLMEADVYYTTQTCFSHDDYRAFGAHSESFGEKTTGYAYLKYTDKVEYNGGGLWAGTYTWDRIQSVDNFIDNEDIYENVYSGVLLNVSVGSKLTNRTIKELQGKQWVLRFLETDYRVDFDYGFVGNNYMATDMYRSSTLVGDVTILRLKFETDGKVYNLGAIDNKQTGGPNPSNETWIDIALKPINLLLLILFILLIILFFVLVGPFLPVILTAILKVLWFLIKYLLKGFYYVIASPVYFIRRIRRE